MFVRYTMRDTEYYRQVVVATHIEKAYKLPGRDEHVVALRDINISHDTEIVTFHILCHVHDHSVNTHACKLPNRYLHESGCALVYL